MKASAKNGDEVGRGKANMKHYGGDCSEIVTDPEELAKIKAIGKKARCAAKRGKCFSHVQWYELLDQFERRNGALPTDAWMRKCGDNAYSVLDQSLRKLDDESGGTTTELLYGDQWKTDWGKAVVGRSSGGQRS